MKAKRALIVIACILAAIAVFLLACLFYYLAVTKNVRLDPDKLSLNTSCVRLFDADGKEIDAVAAVQDAGISTLPEHVGNAFVAVEDKRFYSHSGADFKRVLKAAMKNVLSFSFREGASTISQQLIKNTHLSSEKTVKRKLQEYKLTRALEKRYSKEEILELYLNSIYFGHNAFGIESAARFYFGKEADELLPAESAMLAALVKSPNRYSPFKDAEKCRVRRDFVLSLMQEQGYISETEYKQAVLSPLPQAPSEAREGGAYTDRVFEELTQIFPDLRSGEVFSLRVYTYLKPEIQHTLETQEFDSDGCFVVVDNKTHGIKALHATLSPPKRLPASLLKPLLVYAPAIEENLLSPATPVLDEKTDFGGYSPSNYGGTFGGYMSARHALAHSVNVPAVKFLNSVGVERAAAYLAKMDLNVPKEDRSLALALGGMSEGFTLPALADGYTTLACGGEYAPSRAIARVEDEKGNVLYRHEPKTRRVYSEATSYLVNNMLQTAVQEGTAKRLKVLDFPVCAKTGTGGEIDAYTVAYTREDTVAVWLGNRDNSPIQTMGGGRPANIALSAMQALYKRGAPEPFPPCDGVCEALLDTEEYETNHRLLLADPACPPATSFPELFKRSDLPLASSTRFSCPTIQNPRISVVNGAICIELCQTKYYDYVIKREGDGQTVTVYSGKYRDKIYDNSVASGVSYRYTVIPVFREHEGEPVRLPSVRVEKTSEIPDDWWE